jgi:hypothetical protein
LEKLDNRHRSDRMAAFSVAPLSLAARRTKQEWTNAMTDRGDGTNSTSCDDPTCALRGIEHRECVPVVYLELNRARNRVAGLDKLIADREMSEGETIVAGRGDEGLVEQLEQEIEKGETLGYWQTLMPFKDLRALLARATRSDTVGVEAVARAMCEALNAEKPITWDKLHREERALYETAAKAAIAAMSGGGVVRDEGERRG